MVVAALRQSRPNLQRPTHQSIHKPPSPNRDTRRIPMAPVKLEELSASTAPPNATVATEASAEPRIDAGGKLGAPPSGSSPQPRHVQALLKGLLCMHDAQYHRSFVASEGVESVSHLLASTQIFLSKMQAHQQRHPIPQDGCPGCAGIQALKTFASVQLELAALHQQTERREALERILTLLDPPAQAPVQPLGHVCHSP